jgi:hypothetical protein
LIHNGTLRTNAVTTPYFTVDSESICYALSLKEPSEAYQVLESLEGAFALIWWDHRDKSWNVARNEERPLTFMTNTTGDTMWFSSEAGILFAATNEDMNSLDPTKHIFNVPENTIWKIKPDATNPAILAREVRAFTPKKWIYTYPTGSNNSWKRKTNTTTTTNTTEVVSHTTKHTSLPSVRGVYAKAQEAYLKHFGKPSWQPLELDTIGADRGGCCTISGWMVNEPFAKVVMHNVSSGAVKAGDTIDVFLSTFYTDQYHNQGAVLRGDMSDATLTAINWRKSQANEPLQCECCSGVFLASEMEECDDGYVCKKCLEDAWVYAYFKKESK